MLMGVRTEEAGLTAPEQGASVLQNELFAWSFFWMCNHSRPFCEILIPPNS